MCARPSLALSSGGGSGRDVRELTIVLPETFALPQPLCHRRLYAIAVGRLPSGRVAERASQTRRRARASADDAWRRLVGLVLSSESRRDRLLERLGLTRGDSRALSSLELVSTRTIGSLADDWRCDASTATRIVDRLEVRGFAQRKPMPGDRRQRGVALTPLGVRMKAQLAAGLLQPPPEITALTEAELQSLIQALHALPEVAPPAPGGWTDPRPGLDIRPLLPGHEERLLEAARLFGNQPLVEATRRFLVEPGHHVLVAYYDGTPVGFVEGIEQTQPDKGTEMFIAELAVDERWRGRGVGRQLIDRLVDLARSRRCYGMWTLTDATNAAALAMYRRSGASSRAGQVMLWWEFERPG